MIAKPLLLSLAALSCLALAGCGDKDDDAAVSVQRNTDGSSTVQVQVPESMAPAADAVANPDAALQNLQDGAAAMGEDAKLATVQAARSAAEATARTLGKTDAEITQAGDEAERKARDAMGMQ